MATNQSNVDAILAEQERENVIFTAYLQKMYDKWKRDGKLSPDDLSDLEIEANYNGEPLDEFFNYYHIDRQEPAPLPENTIYFNYADIQRALNFMFEPGETFTVIVYREETWNDGKKHNAIYNGFFRSADAAIKALEVASYKNNGTFLQGTSIYINPQAIRPELYDENPGKRNSITRAGTGDSISAEDVTRFKYLVIDVDPKRNTTAKGKKAATDDEVKAGKIAANQTAGYMRNMGFNEPFIIFSGNGQQLLYKIDLENTDDNAELISVCLDKLNELCKNHVPGVDIDASFSKPAQPSKLAGTLAQKGDNTPERPHRMARILSVPDSVKTNEKTVLYALAGINPPVEEKPKKAKKNDENTVKSALMERPADLDDMSDVKPAFPLDEWLNDFKDTIKVTGRKNVDKKGTAKKPGFKGVVYNIICIGDHDSGDQGGNNSCQISQRLDGSDAHGAITYNCKHGSCKYGIDNVPGKTEAERAGEAWKRLRNDVEAMPENALITEGWYIKHPQKAKEPEKQTAKKTNESLLIRTGSDEVNDFLSRIQTETYKPIPTGDDPIDKMLAGGFIRQEIYLLGAQPGAGKTMLAQQLLYGMAKAGAEVVYLNFEMSAEQLIARNIARIIKANNSKSKLTTLDILRGYKWSANDEKQIKTAAEQYKTETGGRLIYSPTVRNNETGETRNITPTVNEIMKVLTALCETAINNDKPAPLICLDYLQLVQSEGKDKSDPGEVIKDIMRRLKKDIAIKYDTVVLVIMANNRESNKNGISDMFSGRDTSAIEYGADCMLGLSYAALYNHETYIARRNADGEPIYKEYTLSDITDAQRKARQAGSEVPDVCRRMMLHVNKDRFLGAGGAVPMYLYGEYATFDTNPKSVHNMKYDSTTDESEFIQSLEVSPAPEKPKKRDLERDKILTAFNELQNNGEVDRGALADALDVTTATLQTKLKDLFPGRFKTDVSDAGTVVIVDTNDESEGV